MTLSDLTPSTWAARALAGLAVAAVGFAGGWAVNGWRLGERVATIERDAAEDVTAKLRAAELVRDALAGQLAADDKAHTANLKRLTDENDSLRGAVAAGSRVVRIRGAVCPDVPQAPAGSGVDSGAGAALAPDAGQDWLSLRAGIIHAGEQLAACQSALRAFTGQ